MITKIPRALCYEKYNQFPKVSKKTLEFDFYPKLFGFYWVKLNSVCQSEEEFRKSLINALLTVFRDLNINELIFLNTIDHKIIADHLFEDNDHKPLERALSFYKEHHLADGFNGGIRISKSEFYEFLEHFYTLTVVDSGFYHLYFLDKEQRILIYLHHSGEVQFNILDLEIKNTFLSVIRKSNLQDSHRDNTDRI